MDIFNIWDLERVHIRVKERFLKKVNKEISSQFGTKRKFYEKFFNSKKFPFATFKNLLKPSYMKDFFVSLDICLKIVEKLGISRYVLQKEIIAYKTGRGKNYIIHPILPIIANPLFDMFIAHNISDGTVIDPKNGRLPYFGYRQFDAHYRKLYVEKIEGIFGKIIFEKRYFDISTRPYCPPALSSLFFNCYGLNSRSFLSKTARIPKEILSKEKDHLLAVLLAFIIDEGYIDSTLILIKLKNYGLIEDLKEICDKLDYSSKIVFGQGELKDYGSIYILRKGMRRLYGDYLNLRKEFPAVDLGLKGERLKRSFEIYGREIYKSKGNKDKIFEILKKEPCSVNQLAIRLNMTRQGIRFHIHNLIKARRIKILDKSNSNWIYGI